MTQGLGTVLLVEDDEALRNSVTQALGLEGFYVVAHGDARTALRELSADFSGAVVSDVRLPGMDGIEFFARLRELDPEIPVIFTTAHGDIGMAVEAMKNGAADFFPKPYSIERLSMAIERAIGRRALVIENRKLRAELAGKAAPSAFGRSAASRHLEMIVTEVAQTDADLLLRGAPGTGKSSLARQIHERSGRSDRPFVVVDPAIFANEEADLLLYGRDPSIALSRSGMIERAHGGTLVLEAIESIPRKARTRLAGLVDTRSFIALGATRPHRVDIRIIATTVGEDLQDKGSAAQLADRLGGVSIDIPPLAHRREDIPDFFRRFVAEYELLLEREAPAVTEQDWHHLLTHQWPGNLRELRSYAQGFVLGLTRMDTAGPPLSDSASLKDMLAKFEKTVLEDALSRAGGSVGTVQAQLAIPRKTLYDKLARHRIRPGDYRKGAPAVARKDPA